MLAERSWVGSWAVWRKKETNIQHHPTPSNTSILRPGAGADVRFPLVHLPQLLEDIRDASATASPVASGETHGNEDGMDPDDAKGVGPLKHLVFRRMEKVFECMYLYQPVPAPAAGIPPCLSLSFLWDCERFETG